MNQRIKTRIEQIGRGEVPDGYKKVKTGVIPEMWRFEKLGKYLIQYHEVTTQNNQYPVLTSSRRGIFLQSEYYNSEVASDDNTGYNIVPRGYFTYRHMSDDEIFHFNINDIVDNGIVSTLYPVFTTTDKINDYFLQTILNEGRDFRRYAILQKQGGSRTYMYFEKLKALSLPIPPIEEQERIAEILGTQDKLIAFKEKRIAEKKQQKKYLMQQLFTGKKRLPGFTGEWGTVKLGACISEANERSQGNGQYNILSVTKDGIVFQSDHFNKQIASEDTTGYKILKKGQLAFSSMNLWLGSLDVLDICEKGIVSPAYKVFSFDDTLMLPEFGKYFLRTHKMVWVYKSNSEQGASVVRRNFLSTIIEIPSIIEQKRMVGVLSQADKEIELLQKDLEEEKRKKKALMQLLLTGIVRVK